MKVNIRKSSESEKRERERKFFKEILKETKNQKENQFEARKKQHEEHGF